MIKLGRIKLEVFAGRGGLFNVILHSAKGQQEIELTPGEAESLRAAATELEQLRAEVADLRAKQAAFVEATSHGV